MTGGDLLYVSPVLPAPTGSGIAMRAHVVLRALAAHFRVFPLIVPYGQRHEESAAIELDGICVTPRIVPRPHGTLGLAGWVASAAAAYAGRPFATVHVFRLAMLPFAEPYLYPTRGAAPQRHLDLDDVESTTRRRLAALYRLHGRTTEAELEESQIAHFSRLEADTLRSFDRVYVCSESDRSLLSGARADLIVLPNAVAVPPVPPARSRGGPFTFLFVGTLGYIPNEDAVLFFCDEVLPILRAAAPRPFRIVLVGTGVSAELRARLSLPNVEIVGAVPDVAPWYQQADVAIVPIRGGGGTRIKLLEAFAHRRPVVTTTIGVEGIDARDGEHVLIADTAAAIADRCLGLMRDRALGERLVANAFALLASAYTVERVRERLAASFAATARR